MFESCRAHSDVPEVLDTGASLVRRALAERIAPAYASDPAVVAVLLGGSAAGGHADRFSDLELFVIRSEPPTDAGRAGAIAAAGGDLVRLYPVEDEVPGPIWSDGWKIGRNADVPFTGIEVDMQHVLSTTVEETLRDVVDEFDTDVMKHNFIGGLAHAIPLHGEALLESWQRQAATYPDQLRAAVVRAHAQIEGLWRLDAFCQRSNPIEGHRVLIHAHEQLLHTLLGLNRVYYSGFKSLERVDADLELKPRDLLDRVRASYPLRPTKSRELLTELVEETYDLVEEHVPEIDVDRLRTILGYERPLWD